MSRKFLVKKRPSPIRPLFVMILLVGCVAFFELYRWIVPFLPRDPLYHEATIGEYVIGNWTYQGEDEEGYLKFSNGNSSPVLYPPSEHTLDFDGKFVVLETASPGAITYADPIEAVPARWLGIIIAIFTVGFASMSFMWRRRRNKVRFRSHRPRVPSHRILHVKSAPKSRRFRPK